MMVGNKVDLEENRQVDEGMAAGMAKDKNMYFYEVSAKSAFKVDQAFNEFAKLLVKNKYYIDLFIILGKYRKSILKVDF